VHYNLGKACFTEGNLDEAIQSFEEAIRLDQDYAVAHFKPGLGLRRQGKTEKRSRVSGSRAAEPRPRAGTHNLGSHCSARTGRRGDPPFPGACRAAPEDAEPYYNLALIFAHAVSGFGNRDARHAAALRPADQDFGTHWPAHRTGSIQVPRP